ncbi:hypothetical protein GY45DRAFT_571501 [Cubamyces sp. BRFM 1775]|nr:hypothetical protein GY45DRAFT_571501 [Cubamyces sp. BRFM 1775]
MSSCQFPIPSLSFCYIFLAEHNMRSPVLAFSLFAAVVTTASAQVEGYSGIPLSPEVQSHAETFRMKTPRQYGEGAYLRPHDADRGIAASAHREPQAASRLDRPPQPHLNNGNGRFGIPAAAGTTDGGFSDSGPAVGADAGEGGNSASSANGDSASGTDLFHFGPVTGNPLTSTASTSTQDAVPAGDNGGYAYHSTDNNAYRYYRMKRVARTELRGNMSKRADWDIPADADNWNIPAQSLNTDEPDDENSGQDGADGVSQRGSETPGSGPYGGQAHSGEVGSSEGGHVYNEPASNES